MISSQRRRNLRIKLSRSGKDFHLIDCDVTRSSIDPAISTSLIHGKVSSGVDVLKLSNTECHLGLGIFRNAIPRQQYNFEIKFLQYDAKKIQVSRFLVDLGVGIVELCGSHLNILVHI